jgi:hypothetical protein
MDTTETTEHQFAPIPESVSQLAITEEARYYLTIAGKWANFLAIVGFVFTGFMILGIVFTGTVFSGLQNIPSVYTAQLSMALGYVIGFVRVIDVAVAAYCFFFSLYLYQFGSSIKKGILFNDNVQATLGFEKLKSFFKLWGISTIIIIILYIIMIIGLVMFVSYLASAMNQ